MGGAWRYREFWGEWMVEELGNFWWLGQLGQVLWGKYGRSGVMYWGVGGGKRRCVGDVGSVLGCGKVWGGVGSCVEVCLGRGEMCLGCGERCGKGVGVRGELWDNLGELGSLGRRVVS